MSHIHNNIIEGCKQGDEQAFKKMYEHHAPYVYTIIKDYVSEHEERKDVLQDVFAHIFLSIEKFDKQKGSFKSWIRRITIHRCANHLRSKSHLHLVFSSKNLEEQSIDNEFLEQIDREDIEYLLRPMPEGYRTIFLLKVMDGYSHKEIASLLDIREQTSRSQLARAIRWIKNNSKMESCFSKMMRHER